MLSDERKETKHLAPMVSWKEYLNLMNRELVRLHANRLRSDLSQKPESSHLPRLHEIIPELAPEDFLRLQNDPLFLKLLWSLKFDRDDDSKTASVSETVEPEFPKVRSPEPVSSETGAATDDALAEDRGFDAPKPSRLPDPGTLLEDIDITPDMDRFVQQLYNLTCSTDSEIKVGRTLQDILDLSESQLDQIPNVGSAKIEKWNLLKSWYDGYQSEASVVVTLPDFDESNPQVLLDQVNDLFDIGAISIDYNNLEKYEKRILNLLEENFGCSEISAILAFDPAQHPTHSLGERSLQIIQELQNGFVSDLKYFAGKAFQRTPERDGEIRGTRLVFDNRETKPQKLKSLNELESLLITSIEEYLCDLADDDKELIQRRWGYQSNASTLEEIGNDRDISRERIRQIESKLCIAFQSRLSVQENDIWELIQIEKRFRLPSEMPLLFAKFHSEKLFVKFLEFVAGKQKIPTMRNAGITDDILDYIFVNNGAPLLPEKIQELLLAHHRDNLDKEEVADIDRVLSYLEQRDVVQFMDEGVSPLRLSKGEAVACVLSQYPEGLEWIEISKEINRLSLCKTAFSLDRKDGPGFEDTELVFWSGNKTHTHCKYIDFDELDFDAIFEDIKAKIRSSERNVLHLNEIYRTVNDLHQYDYYVIRYLVKKFGEESGIYFQGKSRSDSVSLQSDFKNVTQVDVILSHMKEVGRPISKKEIAQLLMSKSEHHASFYLTGLLKDGRVVEVEGSKYSVPELVYESESTEYYADKIHQLLVDQGKPVDLTWLHNRLNREFMENNTCEHYASIIRIHMSKRGWHKAKTLVCTEPFDFTSLTDAIEKLCVLEEDWNTNIGILANNIAVDTTAAYSLFSHMQIVRNRHALAIAEADRTTEYSTA